MKSYELFESHNSDDGGDGIMGYIFSSLICYYHLFSELEENKPKFAQKYRLRFCTLGGMGQIAVLVRELIIRFNWVLCMSCSKFDLIVIYSNC